MKKKFYNLLSVYQWINYNVEWYGISLLRIKSDDCILWKSQNVTTVREELSGEDPGGAKGASPPPPDYSELFLTDCVL